LFRGAQLMAVYFLVQQHVAEPTMVVGPSMLPTLHMEGDVVLLSHLAFTPQAGDLVVFKSPLDPRRFVVKRVVGVPGDTVLHEPWRRLTHNRIELSKIRCDGPPPPDALVPLTVPPGTLWVQGDNVANSTDSRHYGPVPIGLVVGRVV
ncbi:LexA/Signal peptidase, partial [Caulochytrium protostelioides]